MFATCEECGHEDYRSNMLVTPEGETYCQHCRGAYEAEVFEDFIEDIFGIDL